MAEADADGLAVYKCNYSGATSDLRNHLTNGPFTAYAVSLDGQYFWKSPLIVGQHSIYTRALTFENLWQCILTPSALPTSFCSLAGLGSPRSWT